MTGAALLALLSHWRRHPGQLATLLLGLALATALWSGVQAINAEARASYDRASSILGQDRLTRLVSPVGGDVPLETYVALRRAGWLVSPVMEGEIIVAGTRLLLIGIDPLTAPAEAQVSAMGVLAQDPVRFLDAPGVLLVAPGTAGGAALPGLPPLVLAPDMAPGIAITDIATAARLLRRDDLSHLILSPLQPTGLAPLESLTDLIRQSPAARTDLSRLTESFHMNLTAFGLLSFAVGLFIVHGAIGLAFEQRRTTLRTLRALGLPLRVLMALLFAEVTGFALVSGAVGAVMGYGVAAALLPDVAGTLRNLYGARVTGTLAFDPAWAGAALLIACAGAWTAAAEGLWQVARLPLLAPAQPRAWARASARSTRIQALVAAILLVASAALAVWGQSLLTGFLCLGGLLIGAALILPWGLGLLLGFATKLAKSPFAEWVFADTRQQLPGLSLALMALLLALSANVGVSTMVGSFRATFTGWLDQRLASELYVTARDPAEAEAIRAYLVPRSQAQLPIAAIEARLDGQPAEIFGVADHPTYRANWPLLLATTDVWDQVAAGTGALINEQLYRRSGFTLGQPITLRPGWVLPVVGVYSDYGNPAGQAIVGFEVLRAQAPELEVLRYAVRVAPEDAPALAEAIRTRFDLPLRNVRDQAAIKAFSISVFEQAFRVTGALNLLTLGVAALALLTSLLTLATMRLPQLAPVWALGTTRKSLARVELGRSLILAAMTWLVSLPVGIALAWVLLAVVNVEAFGWRLPLYLFPQDWLRLGGYALLAAFLAAALPALRLGRIAPADLLKVFAHER